MSAKMTLLRESAIITGGRAAQMRHERTLYLAWRRAAALATRERWERQDAAEAARPCWR